VLLEVVEDGRRRVGVGFAFFDLMVVRVGQRIAFSQDLGVLDHTDKKPVGLDVHDIDDLGLDRKSVV
jgi:hypothetical protein